MNLNLEYGEFVSFFISLNVCFFVRHVEEVILVKVLISG